MYSEMRMGSFILTSIYVCLQKNVLPIAQWISKTTPLLSPSIPVRPRLSFFCIIMVVTVVIKPFLSFVSL